MKMGGIFAFAVEMARRETRAFPGREFLSLDPVAWKPAYNTGSHISTTTTAAGSLSAMKMNSAKIADLVRFLHRTECCNHALSQAFAFPPPFWGSISGIGCVTTEISDLMTACERSNTFFSFPHARTLA